MEGLENEMEGMSEDEAKIRAEVSSEIFGGDAPGSAAEPQDEVDDEAKAELKPETDPAESDPWAGVDPVIREKIQGIDGRMSELTAMEERLKQTERRIGSIQNEFHAAKKAADETPGTKAPTDQEMSAAAGNEGAWEELKDEYPVWAEAIESKLASHKPDVSGIRDSVNEIKEGMITSQALETRLVNFVHPGWENTVNSQEYKTWLASQPEDIRTKHYSGSTAEDAVFVLDKFKEFKSNTPSAEEITLSRKNRLSQATNRAAGKNTKPPKAEADMSEEEIRANEAKKIWG